MSAASSEQAAPFRQFRCMTCGHIYDEAEGDPEHGYPPGTRFEDLPDDWLCPECGMLKEFYEPYEPF